MNVDIAVNMKRFVRPGKAIILFPFSHFLNFDEHTQYAEVVFQPGAMHND